MAQIDDFKWKNTDFLCEKIKKSQKMCVNMIKTILSLSFDKIIIIKVEFGLLMTSNEQFSWPPIFYPLYIPISKGGVIGVSETAKSQKKIPKTAKPQKIGSKPQNRK